MTMLDAPEVYEIDGEGMFDHAESLGVDFLASWRRRSRAPRTGRAPGSIVVVGMGGSGVAGDYCAAMAGAASRLPVILVQDYRLPAFAGPETLVILCSHSGETPEVLHCYDEARRAGVEVAVVSGGGTLGERARHDGRAIERIAFDGMPRAALPYVLAGVLGLVGDSTAMPLEDEEVEAAAAGHAMVVRERLGRHVAHEQNSAKQLATALLHRTPFVLGAGHLRAAAGRFKNQVAENAKVLAIAGALPEAQHNIVEGLRDGGERGVSLVLLDSPLLGEEARDGTRRLAAFAENQGVPVRTIELPGNSVLEDLLVATAWADLTSCYLAMLLGVDPTPIPAITGLKVGSERVEVRS